MTAEPWSVEFERRADKDLERLDRPVRERVFTALERLANDPQRPDCARWPGVQSHGCASVTGA